MKQIQAFAHILTDKGTNAAGVKLTLQMYRLSSTQWINITAAASNAKGVWRATVTRPDLNGLQAPALRLIEGGGPFPRVLAQQGRFTYHASKQILSVDFGVIERLGDTAYKLKPTSSVFRTGHTVAGQPKRADVSGAVLIRNMTAFSGSTLFAAGNVPVSAAAASSAAQPRGVVADNFDAELFRFKARETELQMALSQKDILLDTRKAELTSATKNITELQKALTRTRASETRLQNENQQYVNEASRKVSIRDIAANIGAEVDAANIQLGDENRPYRFGRIEIDLKGTLGPDGKMALANSIDLEKLKSGVTLPGVSMEIVPTRRPVEPTSVKVPDVTGLTETAVRRLLQAVGLRLEHVSKSVGDNSKNPIGQSMQQSPRKGSDLPRNNTVLVVFAAPESSEEDNS